MGFFKRQTERRFYGRDHDEIEEVIDRLEVLQHDLLLSEEENDAMDMAVWALDEISKRMVDGKPITFI